MALRGYRIKFVRDGYEFEAEGDKTFVLDMLKRFAPQTGPDVGTAVKARDSRQSTNKTAISTLSRGKSVSIREFIQLLALKKHTDISLAFGYFLEKYAGIPEFTPADITNCYYDAKLESSNTSQMIIQNIKRGYLMASKKKGEKGKNRYTLTNSGEKFIESKLPKN